MGCGGSLLSSRRHVEDVSGMEPAVPGAPLRMLPEAGFCPVALSQISGSPMPSESL